MNPAEELGDTKTESAEVLEPEAKEIAISARLLLTKEQVINLVNLSSRSHTDFLSKMEDNLEFSLTAEISEGIQQEEKQSDQLNKPVHAKLVFTEEQESDLLEAFNLLDHTGEGKIKGEDFRVAIKALGYEPTKEDLQQMVNAVDKGQTGKLSFENFQTAIMRKVMSKDTDGDIMKSFRLFDINDNGYITFENVKNVSEILGTLLTDEEIEEMIDDADKDFDGNISVEEFMRMIKTSVHIVTP